MTIQGLDKLLKQFEGIANLDWVSAEKEGLEVIAEEARALVPVDTGALQESIKVDVEGEAVNLVAGGGDVDYSLHVEFGTVRMPAQPFMRPAIDTKQKQATKAIAYNLQAQIRSKV